MDQPAWVSEDPMNCVSPDLRAKLSLAVRQLYLYQLKDQKETFDQLVREIEVELSLDYSLVDDICLKLAKDLKGYVCCEDAVWLLGQRADRASSGGQAGTKFQAFLNSAIFAEQCDDADIVEIFNNRLKGEADLSSDPIRVLLANVMLAMAHHRHNRIEELNQALKEIKVLLTQESFTSLVQDAREQNVLYLIQAFAHVAFLFRKTGDKEGFNTYHRKAMSLCQRREWDLGLQMELETYLIRALKSSGSLDEMTTLINSLMEKIKQALRNSDRFEVRYGIKVIRDAYNDISVACSFLMTAKEQLLSVGEEMYASWKETYGAEHHEVVFIASQLVYNYESFELYEDADKYLNIVENAIEGFPETTKIIMQAKAKALIHLWKTHQNKDQLDKAEYYCREEVRVNRKHGLSQQYVANALRNLAFIVKDLGRWEEGLNYLKECLQLSKEYSPSLTAFHQKVENEIKKF